MTIASPPRRTPQDLEADGKGFELVDGEFLEKPMMAKSGSETAMLLGGELAIFLKRKPIARLYSSEQGFQCFRSTGDVDRVRKPDISVVLNDRVAADASHEGWFFIRPDIATEIISTNDKATQLVLKLKDYVAASIPLVWVIYPDEQRVEIHRAGATSVQVLGVDGILDGETILPGIAIKIADILPAR